MFLYFIPQTTVTDTLGKSSLVECTAADLRRLDLEYLDRVEARQVLSGPNGEPGWLVYRPTKQLPGYHAEQQVWRRRTGPAGLWIGLDRRNNPGPDDLARREILPGIPTTLGDDRQWTIAPARDYDDNALPFCALPMSIGLQLSDDAIGDNWTLSNVLPKYRRLWETVCQYVDANNAAVAAARDGQSVRFAFPLLNQMCVDALAVNYCVGAIEISWLGLLTTQTRTRIVESLLDYPTLRLILEKKSLALDTGSTSAGPAASNMASPANTDQLMPTG